MVKLTIELECPYCSEEIGKLSLQGGSSIVTMNLRCGNCNGAIEFTYESLARMLGKREETESKSDREIRQEKVEAMVLVIENLAGPNNDDVEQSQVIKEALKSGIFKDENDAKTCVIWASREGRIYERRPGFWARV